MNRIEVEWIDIIIIELSDKISFQVKMSWWKIENCKQNKSVVNGYNIYWNSVQVRMSWWKTKNRNCMKVVWKENNNIWRNLKGQKGMRNKYKSLKFNGDLII